MANIFQLLSLLFFLALSIGAESVSSAAQNTVQEQHQDLPFRREPFPRCRTCPSIAELRAPSFGIGLEMGYGTVFVRQHNGSSLTMAKVDGSQEYLETMAALARNPQPRMPYGDIRPSWRLIEYRKQYLLRRVNKLLGRPATGTTKVLANMVEELHRLIEQQTMEAKLITAAISTPDHIKFHFDEINDVLDYLFLRNAMYHEREAYRYVYSDLYASKAAFAGSGAGLCQHYLDARDCEIEEHHLRPESVLQLDLSPASLSGAIIHKQAYHFPSHALTTANTSLGTSSQHAQNYWLDVTATIRHFVQSHEDRISYLVLTGSSASDPIFKDVVRDALHDLIPVQALHALHAREDCNDADAEPVWLTAKGAAEIAERRTAGPFMCRDSPECKHRRDSERSNLVKHQKQAVVSPAHPDL